MGTKSRTRMFLWAATLCGFLAAAAVPAEAQREYEPLFDTYNLVNGAPNCDIDDIGVFARVRF